MIFGKMWAALSAQVNKLANVFWTADPIAQMQYEYDSAVTQLQDGRKGLEQYRALVERVSTQVANAQKHAVNLESKVKAYLQAGDRETASKFALEMQKAKNELAENQAQLTMHEESYGNSLEKIKRASGKLSTIREKIQTYDAELKMGKAEAEIAKLAGTFNFDVSTDFGQIEQVIQDKIGLNKAKVRVAADLSQEGIVDIKREQAMEQVIADQALRQFEIDMGLVTAETAAVKEDQKELGPAVVTQSGR